MPFLLAAACRPTVNRRHSTVCGLGTQVAVMKSLTQILSFQDTFWEVETDTGVKTRCQCGFSEGLWGARAVYYKGTFVYLIQHLALPELSTRGCSKFWHVISSPHSRAFVLMRHRCSGTFVLWSDRFMFLIVCDLWCSFSCTGEELLQYFVRKQSSANMEQSGTDENSRASFSQEC